MDTFINAIYLYDDKVLITFNYKEGTQTVTFGEAAEAASKGNGSDLDCFTAPENAVKSKDFMAFLFCKPWLHGFCTVFARFQNVQRVQIVAKSDKGCRNSKFKTCDVSQRNDVKT